MTNTNSSVSTIPPAFSPEGWHRARAIGFVEIGKIFIETKWQHRVRITWELPFDQRQFEENNPDAVRPKLISKEYASNLYGKSHLKKDLLNWLGGEVIDEIVKAQEQGRSFDPYLIVGEICQIKIEHNRNKKGNWYEDVTAVAAIQKPEVRDSFPMQITPGLVLTYEKWDNNVFRDLSEYVKKRMSVSQEYARLFGSDQYNDLPRASAPDEPIF